MSEYTSYSSSGMSGSAGGAVVSSLSQNGISFHDVKAWTTARERAEVLADELEKELRGQKVNYLGNSKTGSMSHDYAYVEAMLSAFCKIPEFREYTEQTRMTELQEVRNELKVISLAGNDNRAVRTIRSNGLLRRRLEKLAGDVQQELCQIEKKVMRDTTSSVLEELGYLVEKQGGFLRGTRGLTCIWAEVNQFGDLSMDMSGFSGLACVNEMHRIENKMQERGVNIKREVSQPHYRPEGGVLVQQLRQVFPEFKKMKTSSNMVKSRNKVSNFC